MGGQFAPRFYGQIHRDYHLDACKSDEINRILTGASSKIKDLVSKIYSPEEDKIKRKENEVQQNLIEKLFPTDNKIKNMIFENPEILLVEVPEEFLLYSALRIK